MEVRNCRACGKLFNYMDGPNMCPTCAKDLEKKFEEVKEYIYDHPRVDINTVAEETEVSVSQIKKWIREERLSFASDSAIGLDCENCGAQISTGRFCKNCKDALADRLSNVYEKPKPHVEIKKSVKEKEKMRFLDK